MPPLIIYWVDTLDLLSHTERKAMEQLGRVVSLTPFEVLLADPDTGRKAAVVARQHAVRAV